MFHEKKKTIKPVHGFLFWPFLFEMVREMLSEKNKIEFIVAIRYRTFRASASMNYFYLFHALQGFLDFEPSNRADKV